MPKTKPAVRTITNVLLPTDFSSGSELAAEYAVELCRALKAKLRVLHVMDLETLSVYGHENGPHTGSLFDDLHKAAEKRMEVFLKNIDPDLVVSTHIEKLGLTPAEEICKDAQGNDIDLIVMSTHGRKGMDRFFLGSVADRVVRTASCPVFTVKMGKVE